MKTFLKIIGVIVALLVILGIIIMFRTNSFTKRKQSADAVPSAVEVSVSGEALERFAGGIRIPTVSSTDYGDTYFPPFDEFKQYIEDTYPLLYEATETSVINDYALLFRWKGKNESLKPLLFLSHYDVVPVLDFDNTDYEPSEIIFRPEEQYVPVGEDIAADWEFPPFSGAVANGSVYGRGTLDMKGMMFSILESAQQLIENGFQPERDIWLAFGHDEEVGGLHGALKVAEYFNEKGMDFEAVYDEGGIIAGPGLNGINRPIALIGIGEKGFLSLRISVRGVGGHSSMPPAKGSLVMAAEIITKLNSDQMPARLIPPIESFLHNTGPEMNFISRMAIANKWLFKPILLKTLTSDPASNALVRSTTAISMAKGSDAPNVLSSVSEVVVNFRLLQGDSVESVIEHVKEICEGYDVDIEIINAREPSGLSPEDTRAFEVIRESVSMLYPDAITTAYITIGGTDAYKYQIVSDNIYRFMPVLLNTAEQRSIHNENEHISIANYARMIHHFTYIMENFD